MADNRIGSVDSKIPETKEEIKLLAEINKNAKWKRKRLLMKEIENAGLPSRRPQAIEKPKKEKD